MASKNNSSQNYETAAFAAGCFWGVQYVFDRIPGVVETIVGYINGNAKRFPNPTYELVCSDNTGYAEAVKVIFDPSKVSYKKLLEMFWKNHDPTTLNRQGADTGEQYRSAIFYINVSQKDVAEKFIVKLGEDKIFDKKIVTEVVPLFKFYEAEDYHKEYYVKNSSAPYCEIVIAPKLEKLQRKFESLLKH